MKSVEEVWVWYPAKWRLGDNFRFALFIMLRQHYYHMAPKMTSFDLFSISFPKNPLCLTFIKGTRFLSFDWRFPVKILKTMNHLKMLNMLHGEKTCVRRLNFGQAFRKKLFLNRFWEGEQTFASPNLVFGAPNVWYGQDKFSSSVRSAQAPGLLLQKLNFEQRFLESVTEQNILSASTTCFDPTSPQRLNFHLTTAGRWIHTLTGEWASKV